jgi:uncharacterized protein (TIGR03437 family)
MRVVLTSLVLTLTSSAAAPDGCPPVRFSSAVSAALLPTPNTHRVLVKQSDGSFTAFDLSNDAPYGVVHIIPHFEKRLRPCTPTSTGLSQVVSAIAQTPSGGYLVAWPASPFSTGIIAYDANFNVTGQTQLNGVFNVVQFADVNNDGKLDVIVPTAVTSASQAISVYLGTRDGSFQTPIITYLPAAFQVPSFTVADVNGDHKPDLVLTTQLANAVLVLLGNGDGTFQPAMTAASPLSPTTLAVADLNGDGKPDLVFADINSVTGPRNSFEPIVAVALGNGDGTFSTPAQFAVGAQGYIAIGDLNGDGFPDIVTGDFTILFGDGKGGFPNRRDYLGPVLNSYPGANSGTFIADINDDGIPDIATGLGNSAVIAGDTISVLFGSGGAKFSGPPVSLVPGLPGANDGFSALAAGDFNGDGMPDLAVADSSGNFSALKGAGDGTFSPSFTYTESNSVFTALAVADFNRDGILDIAGARSGPSPQTIDILLGKGDGTFQKLQTPAPSGAYGLAVGDFNGDGKPDLALMLSSLALPGNPGPDAVEILLGNGDGSFSQGTTYLAGPGATSIVAGDFSGDGSLDLIVANQGSFGDNFLNGNLMLFIGRGDGTFAAPSITTLGSPNHIAPLYLAATDFNRDGKLDLAVSFQRNWPGLAIMLGTGGGAFQPPVLYAGVGGQVLIGDLNGDGIPDLVIDAEYQLGNGDGSFQPLTFGGGEESNVAVLADFNRDGKLDIAFGLGQSTIGFGIAALLNLSQTSPATSIVSAANLAPGPLVPGSIATALGEFLSNAGITIEDAAGTDVPATILYGSPTQANFIIPSGLEAGPATVIIGSASPGEILLAPTAPEFFSVNETGLAAAYATQVSSTGAVTTQPVFSDQNGVVSPVPLDLSAGQTYVTLFATGLNTAATPNHLSGLPVTYAGPAPSILGVQQINLMVPPSFAGSGLISISLGVSPVYFVVK